MRILAGDELVRKVRSSCDEVRNRLWIASPFIGDWNAVRKIVGIQWVNDPVVELRVITDISHVDNLAYQTIKRFRY